MLHAVVRSEECTLHLLGEVDPYGLETLRLHVREARREEDRVRVEIEIEPADERSFRAGASRWLSRLRAHGVPVRVVISPNGTGRSSDVPSAA